MKINFEKNGRKITVEGKDTPSEDDYLIIKGKYLDLTADVSKTDFPNIKFLKNGVNKYLKTKYFTYDRIMLLGKSSSVYGYRRLQGDNNINKFGEISNNIFRNKKIVDFSITDLFGTMFAAINFHEISDNSGSHEDSHKISVGNSFVVYIENNGTILKCPFFINSYKNYIMNDRELEVELCNIFKINNGKNLKIKIE